MNRYLKSSVARTLAIGSQLVLVALVSRWLGADAMGVYAAAFSFASIAAVVMSLGQAASSVKEIPSLLKGGDLPGATEVGVRSLSIAALGAGALAVPAAGLGALATGSVAAGVLAAAMAVGLSLVNTFGAVSRSFGSVFLSEAVKTVYWRVAAIGVLAVAAAFAVPVSVEGLLFACAAAMALSAGLAAVALVRGRGLSPRRASLSRLRRGAGVDLENWTLQSVQAAILNLDVVLVGALLGFADAGAYFVLARMASLVALPLSITNPVVLPAVGRVAKTGPDPLVSRAVRRNAWLNIGGAGAFVVALLLVQVPLFERLSAGEMSSAAGSAFLLLLLSQWINTAVGPTSFASQLFDVRRGAMVILVACLAGLVVTIVYAARTHGLVGAAFAVASWRIVQNLATFELIRRRGGFNLISGACRPAGTAPGHGG